MTERIIGVAIRYASGLVCSLPAPNRHHHVIHAVCALGINNATLVGSTQGFVTDSGRFVDRLEGRAITNANGQAHLGVIEGPLFSEDLW